MKFSIRLLYLYLFSLIGLLITVIGTIRIIQLTLNVYVFKGADRYDNYPQPVNYSPDGKEVKLTEKEMEEQKVFQEKETTRQRQREVSGALAMILVGLPLYKYHWSLIKKDSKK